MAAGELAYQAVVRPVEGTILTVARAAGEGARSALDDDGAEALLAVVEGAHRTAADALAHTPDLLEVLARAGVVDAGGTGYLLFLDALLHVIDGRPLPEPPALDPVEPAWWPPPTGSGRGWSAKEGWRPR